MIKTFGSKSPETLKKLLGSRYGALVIREPSDAVEEHQNDRLAELARDIANPSLKTVTEQKLNLYLGMGQNERLILVIKDMMKRGMKIPDGYKGLVPIEQIEPRDIYISKKTLMKRLIIFGGLWSALLLWIGIMIGKLNW